MRTGVTFVVSLVVHTLALVALLATVLRTNDLRRPVVAISLVAYLLLVASVAFLKGRRWRGRNNVAFGLGMFVAVSLAVLVVLSFAYGLTYPVGIGPSFTEYLVQVAGWKNAYFWLAGPFVLNSCASLVGYKVGTRGFVHPAGHGVRL
jgi:hypothetical protein